MEIPLLFDLIVIFALSVAVLFLFLKARLPATVGFLLTGVLAGPHGFRLIQAKHEVEILAEIGVVLLLFTIGIEFSLKNFLRVKRSVLIGGFLQVGLTIAVMATLVTGLTGLDPRRGVFLGFLLALSSTAIVLKVLQEKAWIDTPPGTVVIKHPDFSGRGGGAHDAGLAASGRERGRRDRARLGIGDQGRRDPGVLWG